MRVTHKAGNLTLKKDILPAFLVRKILFSPSTHDQNVSADYMKATLESKIMSRFVKRAKHTEF